MNMTKTDTSVYTICLMLIVGFAFATVLTGCETWRGMGKDTKNITNKTANTVGNVFGGRQKRY